MIRWTNLFEEVTDEDIRALTMDECYKDFERYGFIPFEAMERDDYTEYDLPSVWYEWEQ